MDEKLKQLWAKLNTSATELWKDDKIFLIIFGVLILVVKFRSLLIDLLVSDANNIFNKASQKDAQLAKVEDKAKEQADALVKHSDDLGKQTNEVTDDWYTKK